MKKQTGNPSKRRVVAGGAMARRSAWARAATWGTAIALAVALAAFAGCAGGGQEPGGTDGPGLVLDATYAPDDPRQFAAAVPEVPAKLAADDYEAQAELIDDNPVSREFVESLSSFSYRSAQTVLADALAGKAVCTTESAEEDGVGVGTSTLAAVDSPANSAYSPISLYYALALVTQGASGQTADELNAALGAPDAAAVPEECGNLFRLIASDPSSTVELANSLWLANDAPFEQSFVDVATRQFYATPFAVAFGEDETDDAIAAWISDRTNGLINPEIKTRADCLAMIINSIYFKGAWVDPFDVADTIEDVFHAESGDVTAEFMVREDPEGWFVETDQYVRASLPFAGGASLQLVLPKDETTAYDIMADPALLEEAFTAYADQTACITYYLPKVEVKSTFDLIPPLQALGVESAFGLDADFSHMTSADAYISEVKQESVVLWDEEGAEAAAYTSIAVNEAAMLMPDEDAALEFRLDKPFLFEIRSSQGIPLFIGLVGDPTETA